MKEVDVSPGAAKLIESMRDIGYTLKTALSDVIDNSITASASKVQIFADTSRSDPALAVIDNGKGMTERQLQEAMRLGSRNPTDERDSTDLGRFGLGLKTASFSQCRRLTVVTRKQGVTSCAIWDLDHVAKTNRWVVQVPDDASGFRWVDQMGPSGTLVLWEDLDRMLELAEAKKGSTDIVRQIDESRKHLELVFHRFLSGERNLRRVGIKLNGNALEPFDPFFSSHAATIASPVDRFRIGGKFITLRVFTLPHHQKVGKADWEKYGGAEGYVKNQGFYVYRAGRLIIHGTWFGLARQTELTKLARVRIDIPNDLDSIWKIDVKKASAQPPYPVRQRLKRIIEKIGATSKRVYGGRGRKLVDENPVPAWDRIEDQSEIRYQVNERHPMFLEFSNSLSDENRPAFHRVLQVIGSTLPVDRLFNDMATDPLGTAGSSLEDEAMAELVIFTFKHLAGQSSPEKALDVMVNIEPFQADWERTERILKDAKLIGGSTDA